MRMTLEICTQNKRNVLARNLEQFPVYYRVFQFLFLYFSTSFLNFKPLFFFSEIKNFYIQKRINHKDLVQIIIDTIAVT